MMIIVLRIFCLIILIIGSNGNGELYGIDSDGVYFNVPAIMDEDDVTVLGDDINLLPDKINNFWK